uniref:C-Kit ligand n=1 Tax=Rhabditophanes sp. KR3021 TaxID=114890 RepID=A0AC35U5C4_9BILA
MLSLISLMLASGSVMKGDSEEWTAARYPNPMVNASLCNVWRNATLCDPDHILTEHWRSVIMDNIEKQKSKILPLERMYTDNTPVDCYTNSTVEIYVILAKKIQTATNESTTDEDLTKFGNEIIHLYGLNSKRCNNYFMLLGVEAAKQAYLRAGNSFKLPTNFFHTVFNRTTNFFREEKYMEGINKTIDVMGDEMVNLFNEIKQTTIMPIENATATIVFPPDNNHTDLYKKERNSGLTAVRRSSVQKLNTEDMFDTDSLHSYSGVNTNDDSLTTTFFIIFLILLLVLLLSLIFLLFSKYYKKRNEPDITNVISHPPKRVISKPIFNEAKFKDRHNDVQPGSEFIDMLKQRKTSNQSKLADSPTISGANPKHVKEKKTQMPIEDWNHFNHIHRNDEIPTVDVVTIEKELILDDSVANTVNKEIILDEPVIEHLRKSINTSTNDININTNTSDININDILPIEEEAEIDDVMMDPIPEPIELPQANLSEKVCPSSAGSLQNQEDNTSLITDLHSNLEDLNPDSTLYEDENNNMKQVQETELETHHSEQIN